MSIETTDHALTDRPEWKALEEHLVQIMDRDLALLRGRPARAGFTVRGSGSSSTTRRTGSPTARLCYSTLHEPATSRAGGSACSPGEINITETAPSHTALRAPRDAVVEVDGVNVIPHVHEVLDRMGACDGIRSGEWKDTPGSGSATWSHRHRRQRPRPGDDLRGAQAVQ